MVVLDAIAAPTIAEPAFLPWVGADYERSGGIFGLKLLILGESMYEKRVGSINADGITRMIHNVLARQNPHRFFTKIHHTIGNKNGVEHFWNSVLFYNFVQTIVGEKPRRSPTAKMWQYSVPAFKTILAIHRPCVVVVLGRRLWKHLGLLNVIVPSDDGFGKVDSQCQTIAAFINHPSSRAFTPKKWLPRVDELLRAARTTIAYSTRPLQSQNRRQSQLIRPAGFRGRPDPRLRADFAVFADVVEFDRYAFGDARLLHGDPVEGVGEGHGFFRVGDDDELRPLEKLAEHADEAFDIGFVERGIDFVEHAEGAGAAAKNRQEQGHAGEGLFTAGKERDVARLFAGGPGDNFDAAFQYVGPLFEHNICLAAAEQFAEELLEMAFGGFKRFGEEPAAVGVNAVDDFFSSSDALACDRS